MRVVYRSNFVATVFAARQFINHKHVRVNGSIVNIPSYRCKPGDVVDIKENSRKLGFVLESTNKLERGVPDYLNLDLKNFRTTYTRFPSSDEIPYATLMSPKDVVEFYSR